MLHYKTIYKTVLMLGLILSFSSKTFAQNMNTNYEKITLGAGCFWCVEAIFEELNGVISVESGFSGGETVNPTYKEVCSGNSGHAEVCQITFDPKTVSVKNILEVFFSTHNPTTLNRQGNDVGEHYRSVIFYHTLKQKETSEQIINVLDSQEVFSAKIVTEVSAYKNFYNAGESHQDYYKQNQSQPYCNMVIKPKVDKFKQAFQSILR